MSNINLHQAIDNAMNRPQSQVPVSPDGMNKRKQEVDEVTHVQNEPIIKPQTKSLPPQNKHTSWDKKMKKTGWAFMGLFVAAIFMYNSISSSQSVNTTDDAKIAIEEQMSNTLSVGTRLMSKDESLNGKDLTIAHSRTEDKTKIYVWDYAAEDGDYVQILIDGVALGDPFMIMNKPVEYEVPTVGEIKVVGTHDGGGGITYAIHYDLNGITYFNGTSVGDGNTYTLIRE